MSNIVEADYKVVIDDDLPTLVARIKTAEATVYRVTLAGVIEIGKCLEAAKEKVKHGEWEEWCTENLGYSQRQAQRFMKIADTYGNENSIFGKKRHVVGFEYFQGLQPLEHPRRRGGIIHRK